MSILLTSAMILTRSPTRQISISFHNIGGNSSSPDIRNKLFILLNQTKQQTECRWDITRPSFGHLHTKGADWYLSLSTVRRGRGAAR